MRRRRPKPKPARASPERAVAPRSSPVTGSVGPLAVEVDAVGELVVPVGLVTAVAGVPAAVVGVLTAAARTTIVPCMNGWMVQKYVIVPARVKVCDALLPFLRSPVSKLWSLAVALCSLGPALVHVTVSPTCTVSVPGENW